MLATPGLLRKQDQVGNQSHERPDVLEPFVSAKEALKKSCWGSIWRLPPCLLLASGCDTVMLGCWEGQAIFVKAASPPEMPRGHQARLLKLSL